MKGNSIEMMSTDICRRWISSPIGMLLLEADAIGLTTLYIEETESRQDGEAADSACEQKIKDTRSAAGSVYGQKDEEVAIAYSECPLYARSECIQKRILDQAQRELEEYFAGARQTFETPLHMRGTGFQKQVWNALRQIPYGETRSYAEIARLIGNPQACRAVGGANNKNKILLMVPCHRVVGKNGELTGFAAGLQMKETLLKLERDIVRRDSSTDKEDRTAGELEDKIPVAIFEGRCQIDLSRIADDVKIWLLFTGHYSARCFRANLHENPEDSSAKLHEMQFLCIAKRVAVNGVNSNKIWSRD